MDKTLPMICCPRCGNDEPHMWATIPSRIMLRKTADEDGEMVLECSTVVETRMCQRLRDLLVPAAVDGLTKFYCDKCHRDFAADIVGDLE
jgi:hypothetical protein